MTQTTNISKYIWRDFAWVLLGGFIFFLPEHGITGKWLRMGDVVGTIISGFGLVSSFSKLFLSQIWISALRNAGVIARLRVMWVVLGVVFVFAWILAIGNK